MSERPAIPVRGGDSPAPAGGASAQVLAVLTELGDMLEGLVADGRNASVDVRSLPLLPGDYDVLRSALGKGEVTATVDALGPTSIQETAIAGLWWVTHRNTKDEVVAELIEVTALPELLRAQPQDLREGPARLRARLATLTEINA